MYNDLRYAFRMLRNNPGFTVVSLLVLTLGIGATTAIFSVVDAVVLRGLPFDEPDRLVAVGERSVPGKGGKGPVGSGLNAGDPLALSRVRPQNYIDWAAQQQVFESMAAIADLGEFTLQATGGEPEDLVGHRVTAGFFDVLRSQPALGRAFTVDSEVEGRHRLAVLSDALWRRRFGADPHIIGRPIPLEDGSYEIVGVMPPGFTYPVGALRPTDLWVPYVVPPNERIRRGFSVYLQTIARMKPGVSLEQAQAHMDQIAAAIEKDNPTWNQGSTIGVRPLRDHLVGANIRSWMMMLLAAVGIVLLIACANVANLLLARASVREREVAIRAALCAGRWRLVRQFIVESLVLSVAGTVLSVILAWWVVQVLRNSMPEGVPRVTTIALDLRVLGTAAGLSLVTGLLFGIVPALQMSKPDLATSLKDGARGASSGRGSQRLRGTLVVVEVALAVVLLVGAALFIGSFIRLMRVDPGFNPDGVLTLQIFRRSIAGQQPPDWSGACAQIVERLSEIGGVVHASAVSPGIPLSARMRINRLEVPGRTMEGDRSVSIKSVTPDYHKALRIPLRNGRLFEVTDRAGGANVVIINESAAKALFPGEEPVGRAVTLDGAERTIVGVVGDAHQLSLETLPRKEAYLPMSQSPVGSAYLVIRTSGDPYKVLSAVKTAVLDVLPDVPVRYVATVEELIARQTAQRRLSMLMLGLFGLLGLVISAVGVYGVMAYVVSQRTQEIGIRMALGATRSKVVGMVLTNACVLVAVGLVIGGAGAWYLSALAKSFLFELEANDPRAFVMALVSLSVAALIATAVPARRAASVDPLVALRSE